jgi:hypothetical protein
VGHPCQRSATAGGRPWRLVALIAAVSVLSAGATLAVATAHRGPAAVVTDGQDWAHVLQVVANLRATPPSTPVILILGGSAARECTSNDVVWAAEIRRRGGPPVLCYNLGCNVQSLADDIALIRELPDGSTTPTLVYIGVNPGRFCAPPYDPTIELPAPVDPLPAFRQHRYDQQPILNDVAKRRLVRDWLTDRYPIFEQRYSYNLDMLERLIRVCLSRGLHPVMLDLPRNTAIIGRALHEPIATYRADCQRLAGVYGVPWVSLVGAAHLASCDFRDLWHMVKPGREKWQRLLTDRTVTLLSSFGMDGGTVTGGG